MNERIHWTLYGVGHVTSHPKGLGQYSRSVTREFHDEGEAWAAAIKARMDFAGVDAVLVETRRVRKASPAGSGQWTTRNKLLLRLGNGRAWYE